MSTSEILAVVGGAFQVVGFGLVIFQTTASLWQTGRFGPLARTARRAWARVRYWFTEPKVYEDTLTATAHASGSLREEIIRANETDIQRLERELRKLQGDLEEYRQHTDTRLVNVEKLAAENHAELLDRAQKLEAQLAEIHTSSLKRERVGAWLFIVGTVLVTIAAVS